MGAMASQINSLTIVYSTVYSSAAHRKHQSSESLAFMREIHRWPVNYPHKRPVTRKMFPFCDVRWVMCPTYLNGRVCRKYKRSSLYIDTLILNGCDCWDKQTHRSIQISGIILHKFHLKNMKYIALIIIANFIDAWALLHAVSNSTIFVQQLLVSNKRNKDVQIYLPFERKSSGDRWISLKKVLRCGKRFHVMTQHRPNDHAQIFCMTE